MILSEVANDSGGIVTLSTELANPSPIYFGFGIAQRLIETINRASQEDPIDKVFFFTDKNVINLCGDEIFDSIANSWRDTQVHILPDGETSKNFTQLEQSCQWVVSKGATKKSLIVAFGGGTVGNLAGFVAGLVFRGIRYIEIPTTFTHQTDGTLSNKQAINGLTGKNHFGLYHAPLFIWTDTRYLKTEPKRVKQAGIVEGIKNAFIHKSEFVQELRGQLRKDCVYSDVELAKLALAIINSKLEILRCDPSEKKYGLVLEYGHTFAHALEWLAAGQLLHGECVAVGMRIAARLARRIGLIDAELVALHDELIEDCLGLYPILPDAITAGSVLTAMRADNKRTSSVIRYVLLDECGSCSNREGDYLVTVPDDIVVDVLENFLAHRHSSPKVHLPRAKLERVTASHVRNSYDRDDSRINSSSTDEFLSES